MKSKSFFNFFSILVAVVAAASLARAEDTPQAPAANGAGSNTVTVTQPATPEYQKFEITYFGIYLGPSFGNLDQSAQINPSTNQLDPAGWPQVLESQLKFNYYLSPDIAIGPVLNFYNFPGQTNNSMIQDSGLRIGDKHLIHNGGLNLSGDIRFLAPISPGDIKNNANVLIESVDYLKYDFPNSKWTAAFLTFDKFHTYSDQAIGLPDADFYFSPNFNWQFSQKVGLTGFVEFYPLHLIGNEGWTVSQPMDINPGISWDVTDNLNLNPGIVFYPTLPNFSATSAILYISDKLL